MDFLRRLFGTKKQKLSSTDLARISMMQIADSPTAFITLARQGPVWTRVPVSLVTEYRGALMEDLKGRGFEANKIMEAMRRDFRAVCPNCSCHVTDEILADVWLTTTFGRGHVIFTSYGPISRMLDGICPNKMCSSSEIRLIWRGADSFREMLEVHLNRIRSDPRSMKLGSLPKCLKMLESSAPLTFAIDGLWGMVLNSIEQRQVTLDQWYKYQGICIWLTTIQAPEAVAKRELPGGYLHSLDMHLREVGYKGGDFAFAQWICTFQTRSARPSLSIHLALLPMYSDYTSNKKKFQLNPTDLMTEAEVRFTSGG